MKKAIDWLNEKGLAFTFHDYKKQGVDAQELARWVDNASWEKLLNTRGTTWRKLPESSRTPMDQDRAISLMIQNPTLIKRPVLTNGSNLIIGFSELHYENLRGTQE